VFECRADGSIHGLREFGKRSRSGAHDIHRENAAGQEKAPEALHHFERQEVFGDGAARNVGRTVHLQALFRSIWLDGVSRGDYRVSLGLDDSSDGANDKFMDRTGGCERLLRAARGRLRNIAPRLPSARRFSGTTCTRLSRSYDREPGYRTTNCSRPRSDRAIRIEAVIVGASARLISIGTCRIGCYFKTSAN
jgi:hypothetical protein